MQTTTFWTKNLFHYTTVIVQKIQISVGYQSNDVFDPENMYSADCKAEFRVEKADLPVLVDALHVPAVFHCKLQRSICDGWEGLCVLLRRTSYPCRLSFCFEFDYK